MKKISSRAVVATMISYGFKPNEIRKAFKHRKAGEVLDFLSDSKPKIYKRYERIENVIKEKAKERIYPFCWLDKCYPENLQGLDNMPVLLWARGDVRKLSGKVNVAVIGTRTPTSYGAKMAQRIVSLLVSRGCNVISGLALGCDAVAHSETVKAYGTTCAVLPSGVDNPVPASNKNLSNEILQKGGILLSEYPLGHSPQKREFVERDRIVAALADIVIVIEAGEKSGTMHTVNYALEYERPVLCTAHPQKYHNEETVKGIIKLVEEEKADPITSVEVLTDLIEKMKKIKANH